MPRDSAPRGKREVVGRAPLSPAPTAAHFQRATRRAAIPDPPVSRRCRAMPPAHLNFTMVAKP
jgi:hypothetical protein